MKSLLIASFLGLLALAGCHHDTPAPTPPDNTAGTGTASGSSTGSAAGPYACATDDDCVISCAQEDNCCDQLCPPCRQAFHKDQLAAIETWREQSCAATSCPVAKCMAPTEETVARCEAGACVVETRPLTAQP